MKQQTQKVKEPLSQLPPQIPCQVPELERAIMLLGSLVRVGLKEEAQRELAALVGARPNPWQAALWKTHLSRFRRELLARASPL